MALDKLIATCFACMCIVITTTTDATTTNINIVCCRHVCEEVSFINTTILRRTSYVCNHREQVKCRNWFTVDLCIKHRFVQGKLGNSFCYILASRSCALSVFVRVRVCMRAFDCALYVRAFMRACVGENVRTCIQVSPVHTSDAERQGLNTAMPACRRRQLPPSLSRADQSKSVDPSIRAQITLSSNEISDLCTWLSKNGGLVQ